ncbi:MAG: hypothetical protein IT341_10505 [Chloroflexi bacterium]|nr:hypothetical protein [Chloroflexota bacterium]
MVPILPRAKPLRRFRVARRFGQAPRFVIARTELGARLTVARLEQTARLVIARLEHAV